MPDPFAILGPSKIYELLLSRFGPSAFVLATVQTAFFLIFVWVGGWVFIPAWSTVGMWVLFIAFSVMLLLAWATYISYEVDRQRDRTATAEVFTYMQEVIKARREAFTSEEAAYHSRREWVGERDTLLKQVEEAQRQMATQGEALQRARMDVLERLRETGERRGLQITHDGFGHIEKVQIVDPAKLDG